MFDLEAIIEALNVATEQTDEDVRPQERPSAIWVKRLGENLTRLLEDQYEPN